MDQQALTQDTFAFSRSIIEEVEKTGQGVVVTDAQKDSRFGNDPYILGAEARSIMCLPIIDKGKFIGIMYLENNLGTGDNLICHNPAGDQCYPY